MTQELRDDELDLLLLDGDPVDVLVLRDVATATGADELRTAITATTATTPRPVPLRRRRRVVAFALAAAAAVAVPLTVSVLTPSSAQQGAYAATVVRFAEQAPRLLMSAPGWRVTDANQTYEDAGSVTFASGTQSIDIDWNSPARSMDPDDGVADVVGVEIDGHPARVGRVTGAGPAVYQAWWSVGDLGIAARGQFSRISAFIGLVSTLHKVDAMTWLDAMPRDEVTPAGRKVAVEKMLADIPRPPRLDVSDLSRSTLLLDRYQLGTRVTSAVSCRWVDVFFHGSESARVEAAAAMGTSHRWAILREMKRSGDFPLGIWEVADYLNGTPTNNLVPVSPGQTVESLAKNHVGC